MNLNKPIIALGAIALGFLMLNVNSYASNSYYLMSCTKQNIPTGYYASIDTSVSEGEFRQTLHDVISANYVKNGYDTAWTIDSYADADPYNEGHIKCLYTGLSVENDSHNPSGDKLYWNREHTWPKSHGFNSDKSEPYTDCHHLRASESKINIAKSNNDFGELTENYTESYGNKYGNGVFEPNDDVKGDVARMLLYMVIRYGEYDSTTFTIGDETCTANLELVDSTTTSISNGNGRLAKLSTILAWHYQDPVSDREIYRNNVVYMFQKNRNPFIDHPEYVEYAFRDSGTYTSTGTTNPEEPDTVERTEEILVDSTGFEASEGFTADSQAYYNKNTYNTNLSWSGYQAAPSTTNKISGAQSMRLSVAKSSYQTAQLFMTDDVYNLNRITFTAKGSSSGNQLHIMYSIDSGLCFKEGEVFNITTSNKSYEYVLSANGGYDKARIGFYFSKDNTSSSSYINIDDLCVYRLKSSVEVEFQRKDTKASLRYSYINEYYDEDDIYFEQISSLDELTIGTEIIIGALTSNYTMGAADTNNFFAIENEATDGVISPLTSTVLTVGEGLTDGTISLMSGNKYLGNGATGSNYLKLTQSLTASQSFNVSMDAETKAVTLKISDSSIEKNIVRFNSSAKKFSCYASGQEDITIYIKKTGSVTKCNTTISNMNLRFGTVIDRDMYDDILSLDSNAVFGISLSKDGISYRNYTCNPAIVSFNEGRAEENTSGNYVQWATVLPTEASRFDSLVYAKAFVIINGTTYYMNLTSYSVKTLAKEYQRLANSLGLSNEEIVSLGGIA